MDEHVNEWHEQISSFGKRTNRWCQDVVREMADNEQQRARRDARIVAEPIDWTKGEWQLTEHTERGRAALRASKVMQLHNAKAGAQRPIEHLIFYAMIIAVLALAAWGTDRRREAAAAAGPQPKSQLMHCASLQTYREQADCVERNGIELDSEDDPKAEVRRR